jgi:predicted ATPase
MPRALYGRDPDLQALAALLASHRLVSIVGTAGVGKTALAGTSSGRSSSPPSPTITR